MSIVLFSNILSQMWLIDENYVQSQLPFILNLLDGKTPETDYSRNRLESHPSIFALDKDGALEIEASSAAKPMSQAPPGSIAVIPVRGALMKNDQYCGPSGTATLTQWLEEADKNPNIKAIILKIDSPGGTVDGTETFANAIKAAKKPVVAFVDGMMASAAMWIGSAADIIIASGNNDFIGSIGVMSSFADFQPLYEKAGVKFHSIYATLSTNKNIEGRSAQAGDYTPYINNILNPINANFHNAIKSNRRGKVDAANEAVFSGQTFLTKDAKKAGLVDEVGNFDYAIKRAGELAALNDTLQNNLNMKFSLKSTLVALISAFGFTPSADSERTDVEITDEQFEKMNADLASLEAMCATNAEILASNSKWAEQNAALMAENTKLKAQLDAVPAAVKPETLKTEKEEKPGMRGAENWNNPQFSWNKKANKL